MKRDSPAFFAVIGAATAIAGLARALPPKPGEVVYGDASASASADEAPPPIVSGRRPWVPDTATPDIPNGATPKPAKAEWATAPDAPDVRITQPGCRAQRLREWYRVSCPLLFAMLIGGNRNDVEFGKFFEQKDDFSPPKEVWVVFPARRGDSRYFQLYTWSKWAPGEPDAQLSESWLEGEPGPSITLQGVRWL